MGTFRGGMVCFFLFLLMAGCSTKGDLFVLLPNEDGTVGQLAVTTRGGSQVLTRANESVTVSGSDAAPTAPANMQSAEIDKIFGPALSAQAPPPLHFLLYFESDSVVLTAKSIALVPDIVEAIQLRVSLDITIVGHTDRAGSEDYNRSLSFQRANRVQEILVENDVDPILIEVTSHGEGNPLIATEDNVPEHRNRRVEVVVR